jgi:hypothetical protein
MEVLGVPRPQPVGFERVNSFTRGHRPARSTWWPRNVTRVGPEHVVRDAGDERLDPLHRVR